MLQFGACISITSSTGLRLVQNFFAENKLNDSPLDAMEANWSATHEKLFFETSLHDQRMYCDA